MPIPFSLSKSIFVGCFRCFPDENLDFRRERQSVILILGEENPLHGQRSKMASGYDTPPGGGA